MRAELERIASQKSLSKDVYEIVGARARGLSEALWKGLRAAIEMDDDGRKRKRMKEIPAMPSFYDFSARDIDGGEHPLSEWKDKVVLVVNVASKCGLTPQYDGLQRLYDEYRSQGVEILGFPCNQFMQQEPGQRVGDQAVLQHSVRSDLSLSSRRSRSTERAGIRSMHGSPRPRSVPTRRAM